MTRVLSISLMTRGTDAATASANPRRSRPPAIVRLLSLRPADVALTSAAIILVLLAHLTVRFVSFARWSRWLTCLVGRPRLRTRGRSASRASAAIARASRRIPRTRCLVEAIAATVFFRLLGLEPELHIGARRSGGAMEAHAWVVCDGVVRAGWLPDLHTFAPFPLERLAGTGRLPL